MSSKRLPPGTNQGRREKTRKRKRGGHPISESMFALNIGKSKSGAVCRGRMTKQNFWKSDNVEGLAGDPHGLVAESRGPFQGDNDA